MSPLRFCHAEDVVSSVSRTSPQWHAERTERLAHVEPGEGDRFEGYAVVGVRFTSGHVLVLRRWPASSIGPAYTSVWHRTPDGSWHMYVTAGAGPSCVRYFPSIVSRWREDVIRLCWSDPYRLRIEVRGVGLEWELDFRASLFTNAFGVLRALLPHGVAAHPVVLRAIEWLAHRWLGIGRVPLVGTMPNGSPFRAVPRRLWLMDDSRAWLRGESLGTVDRSNAEVLLESYRVVTSGVLAFVRAQFGAPR